MLTIQPVSGLIAILTYLHEFEYTLVISKISREKLCKFSKRVFFNDFPLSWYYLATIVQ